MRTIGRKLFATVMLSAVLAGGSTVRAQTAAPSKFEPRELHGGIEINMRGAQAVAVRITGEEENYSVTILFSENILAPLAVQDGKFTPESMREMVAAVQKHIRRMQRDYRIPPDQIYLTGTPNLVAANVTELAAEIKAGVGRSVTLLDVKSAVELSLTGSIPRRYRLNNRRHDNRNISLLIEVMGNKVQGGYQVNRLAEFGRTDAYDFVTFEVPTGSLGLRAEANKIAGDKADIAAFSRATQALVESLIQAPLRNEAARKLGLTSRSKVYLAGPIMRLLVATLHPDERRTYVPLTVSDFNTFYYRLLTAPEKLLNPDLSKIRDEEWRTRIETGLQTARIAFSTKELLAGAEILLAVARELELQNKTIIFPRYNHLAQILSFVRLQPEERKIE